MPSAPGPPPPPPRSACDTHPPGSREGPEVTAATAQSTPTDAHPTRSNLTHHIHVSVERCGAAVVRARRRAGGVAICWRDRELSVGEAEGARSDSSDMRWQRGRLSRSPRVQVWQNVFKVQKERQNKSTCRNRF